MDALASTCIYSYPRKLICCESYRTHSKNTVAEEPLHTKFGVEILLSEYATAIVQYCQESQYWANISNAIHSSSRASSWQRNMTLYCVGLVDLEPWISADAANPDNDVQPTESYQATEARVLPDHNGSKRYPSLILT